MESGHAGRRDGLTVIEGQLTDTGVIAGAVKGADAVISLLGPPSKAALGRFDVAPILDGCRTTRVGQVPLIRDIRPRARSRPRSFPPTLLAARYVSKQRRSRVLRS